MRAHNYRADCGHPKARMAADSFSTRALLRDIAVRIGSDVFNVFTNLVTILFLANYLGSTDYGIYMQVITTATLLVPLLIMRLNTASVRFFPSICDDNGLLKDHVMTILMVVVVVSSLTALLLVVMTPFSTRLIFGSDMGARLVIVLSLFVVLRCVSVLLIDYFRALNLIIQASLYNSIRFLAILAGVLLAIIGRLEVTGIILAQCCAELIVLLLVTARLARRQVFGIPFRFSLDRLSSYFRYSFPLVPYSFFLGVNQLSDRYFIAHMIDIDAAGIYAFTYIMISAAFLLAASLSYVIYPYLSRLWQNGEMEEVSRYIDIGQKIFVFFGLPIAFGVYVIYRPLVTLLAGDGFVVSDAVVIWITVGHFFFGLCCIVGYVIDLSKKTVIYLKILFLTSVINLLLNWLLIPVIGMQGAAISTAVTYAVQLLSLSRMSSKLVPFRMAINQRFLAVCLAGSAIMCLLLLLLQPADDVAGLVLIVLAGIIIYISVTLPFTWRMLMNVFSMIRPRSLEPKEQ